MARQDADDAVDEEEGGASRPGFPVDLFRLRRAIVRGRWWLLAAGAIGAALGYLIAKFVVEHTYQATASLQYSGLPGEPQHVVQRDQPGLVAAAHSEEVMYALRDRMGEGLETLNLNALRAQVVIESDSDTGLISFTSWGDSPERAAAIANTATELFLAFHEERRRNELTEELAGVEERAAVTRTELATARQTYDAFRRANGISDLTAEQEAAIEQAASLRSQADLGHAEVQSLEARVAQLRQELESTPRTETHSSGASDEQRRLRQLRQLLAEARGQGLGDSHPRVQALERQVAALERTAGDTPGTSHTGSNPVYSQIATTLQSAETELEGARQRVATLEQLAVQAQQRTARFSEIEGQAANLLAQVNIKQEHLTTLNEERATIQDLQRDLQTGFRVVAEARPPDTALPSKKKYAVAAGIPLAFLVIMVGALLFRELRGLKVQTAREVAFWGNGPVIGTTTWPRDPRALLDLIADLDDFAPDARGTMLVVGSTEGDRELAAEIARQLNQDWTASTQVEVPVIAALPASTRRSSPPAGRGYYDDDGDEVLSGEIYEGPTEVAIPTGSELALLDMPTEVEQPGELPDPADRLICTAWAQRPEGQALRRAARLADRVLVVVSSGGIGATELATIRTRLGVDDSIGYVLTGVSDEVARLPDRCGEVETFWSSRTRA
ncbi:MAG: hypothetical protein KC619_19285 [Myxococcales bacterium]|nr:hypothetical protein [Myxococcales bacterium]